MSSVQFQDKNNTYTVAKKKGLSSMIIKWGLAKDEKGAQVVLLIIAVVAILVGGFFMFTGSSAPTGAPAPLSDGTVL